MNALLDHLRRTQATPRNATPDGDLLARYLATADESAFDELVHRHGPAVYGACRRQLPDPADAADAFQAVWLVLVRRAGKLAGRSTLGPWLFQVAVWTARNLRRKNARRLAVSGPSAEFLPDTSPDLADLRLDLDAALAALPEKYRTPVVLCHLEGWSRRDAAAHLGCPEGTLSALLARALTKLRKQLGADPAPLLALAAVAVPTGLATAAGRAADVFRTASLTTAGVSPAVADLTRGVLRMFWVKKAVATGLVLVAALGLGVGVGILPGSQPLAASPPQPTKKAEPTPKELEERLRQLRDEQAALERQLHDAKHRELMVKKIEAIYQEQMRLEYDATLLKVLTAEFVPRLEVVLRKGAGIEVHEFDNGNEIGFVLCSSLEMVKRTLTRAHADPKGPKRIAVTVAPDYPYVEFNQLLDVVKAAGFTKVTHKTAKADAPLAVGPPQAPSPPYAIESPDVLRIEAQRRDRDTGRIHPLAEAVTGHYLVRPDGTVSLGTYGSVSVTGLTAVQADDAVRKHLVAVTAKLGEKITEAELWVNVQVHTTNSKVYYVIIEGVSGEQVYRLPLVGGESVVDALKHVKGLLPAERSVSLRRGEQVLTLDKDGVLAVGEATVKSYQIMPGDRVYVTPKK